MATPIDLNNRRELFVDDHVLDSLDGCRLQLHHPTRRSFRTAIVLAPNAAGRAQIVPGPKEEACEADPCAHTEPTPAGGGV